MRISDWSSDVCSSDLPKGTRVQRAPEWTGNASIEYRADLSDSVDLRINPKVDFSSRQLSQLPSVGAPDRAPYALVDLIFAVGAQDDNWALAMVGKTLTKQKDRTRVVMGKE